MKPILPMLLLGTLVPGHALAQAAQDQAPPHTVIVAPVSRSTAPPASDLQVRRGRYFSYALPQGWQVGEDGQFAVTLVAPDSRAFTLMVGNAGMLPNYPLDRYVRERMAAVHPRDLRVGAGREVPPRAGFHHAVQFDVTYTSQRGLPSRGVATCNVAPAYDTALIVMTGAFSVDSQWSGYASWLPMSAGQIAAVDGAAFGRRGIMAQNLQQSKEFGEAAKAYRDWSQQNWQGVTAQRQAANDRQNHDVRENLGSTRAYTNPYDTGTAVELPRTYTYYWVNRQGTYVGTNDPSVNPNDGSAGEWKQMPLQKP
jgi:hypothetical protein